MFDHNILPVVGMPRDEVCVYDFAVGNGAHFIERLAARVALERPNVDPFMEPSINNSRRRLDRVAYKTVLTAFPWPRFHPFVIAFDELVKHWSAASEKRDFLRRQAQYENPEIFR